MGPAPGMGMGQGLVPGLGVGIGPGVRIGVGVNGLGGMPTPYGSSGLPGRRYPGAGGYGGGGYPIRMAPGAGLPDQGHPGGMAGGGFPGGPGFGQGPRIGQAIPIQPQPLPREQPASPPSSEAEAFGLAPYR